MTAPPKPWPQPVCWQSRQSSTTSSRLLTVFVSTNKSGEPQSFVFILHNRWLSLSNKKRANRAVCVQCVTWETFCPQYATQRASFDQCVSQVLAGGAQRALDGPDLCLLCRQLIFFYRHNVDAHRLVRLSDMVTPPHLHVHLKHTIELLLLLQIWLCQNLVKLNSQFVKLLVGPQKQTCMFQIKRILGFCCRWTSAWIAPTHPGWLYKAKLTDGLSPSAFLRLLQNCTEDSLNVAVPMRMLETFSSEKTYLPVIPDASYVASLLEQILHYVVQKGERP